MDQQFSTISITLPTCRSQCPKSRSVTQKKIPFIYEIDVATRWGKWHLEKKYVEFQELHKKLLSQFNDLPEFPQSILNYFMSENEDQASNDEGKVILDYFYHKELSRFDENISAICLMSHNFISKLWKLFDCQTFIRNIMTSARKQSSQQWSYVTGVFYYLLQKSLIRKENLFAFIKNQYRFITKISFNYSIFDDNCKLGDQGIDLIVKTELLFITDISLRGNNITHRGVKQMGKCKWKELKSIDLSINYIKNAGVKYLIKNMWKNLQRLNLRATGLTDDGAKILVKGQWPQLQHVNLQENHLTGQFCNHLIYSNWILFANIFWVSGSDQKQQRGYLQHIKLDQLRRVQLQKQRIKRSISKGENQ